MFQAKNSTIVTIDDVINDSMVFGHETTRSTRLDELIPNNASKINYSLSVTRIPRITEIRIFIRENSNFFLSAVLHIVRLLTTC